MTKSSFDSLLAVFDREFAKFNQSPAIQFLASDEFSPQHYASALREIYFYTRDNPQLQAWMTMFFRGSQRDAVKRVLGHAMSEVGHDELARDDLRAMGYDAEAVTKGNPLPSTIPLIAFPIMQLQHLNPIGYLGHVFFLEFMPTRSGEEYLAALTRAGVPEAALSFVAEHAEVDVQHNRLMEQHVRDLVLSEDDFEACAYAIEVSAHLYAKMLEGAFANPIAKTAEPELAAAV